MTAALRRALIIGVSIAAALSLMVGIVAYREASFERQASEEIRAESVLARDAYKNLKAAVDYGNLRTEQLSQERTNADVPKEAFLFDLDGALAPITRASLLQTRAALVKYLWKGADPNALLPDQVVEGAKSHDFAAIAPTASIKTIHFKSIKDFDGFTEFATQGPTTCLTIRAHGHEGQPGDVSILPGGRIFLRQEWKRGCDLVIVPMPFRSETDVTLDLVNNGRVHIGVTHEALGLLDTADFSAFRLFFDPLFASLNWLETTNHRYTEVNMAGVSGGGWMSIVYPAIDPRVTNSIAVAGGFPTYLRFLPTENTFRDIGDWEQGYGPFYQIANFFELTLLGGLDKGRHQTLVYNAADPCCFSGYRAMTFLPNLERRAKEIGVSLTSIIDSTHFEHDMSEYVMQRVAETKQRNAHANAQN
jgi:hypothetical protein